jgi:hypothetical protein
VALPLCVKTEVPKHETLIPRVLISVSEKPFIVRALAYIIPGRTAHLLRILRDRYL